MAPSPATSSAGISHDHSRPPSLSSQSNRAAPEKDSLSLALDHIHSNASQSDTLTTFDDFTAPRPGSKGEAKSFAGEIVQGGLSGLYSRIKASVGAAKEAVAGAVTHESPDDSSMGSARARSATMKSSTSGIITSPMTASAASSRLQSPLAGKFSESQASSGHLPGSSGVSTQSRSSNNFPLPISLALQRSSSQIMDASEFSDRSSSIQTEPHSPDDARQRMPLSRPAGSVPSPTISANRGARHVDSSLEADSQSQDVTGAFLVRSGSRTVLHSSNDSRLEAIRLSRQDSDRGSTYTDNSGLSIDPDQTPRNSGRSAPERLSLGLEPVSISPLKPFKPVSESFDLQPVGSLDSESLHDSYMASQRPSLIQVSQSHLPGFRASRANSSDGDLSSVATTVPPPRQPYFEAVHEYHIKTHDRVLEQAYDNVSRMKSKILAKELWMRDENAKDCFYCGDTFSAFRRKHHCRICGNIFDHKCTSLVPGKLFGQSGRLRICKPCEAIVYGTDDDSSVYTDDGDRASQAGHPLSPRFTASFDEFGNAFSAADSDAIHVGDDHMNIGTPTMGVPISRKSGESKRRSAIIEFDGHHSLPRPSSSRSLKSLSGRPRSSSHKRHNSRHGHQHMKSLKSFEDHAPFQRHESEASVHSSLLPAFHHDNIIDPDLAPFLSDEGSSEDEAPSIFATLTGDPQSPGKTDSDKAGFSSILASVRRGKPWGNEKSASMVSRDADNASTISRNPSRHNRKRNLSITSAYHPRSSPRRSKSNSLLKGFPIGHGPSVSAPLGASKVPPLPSSNSKMIRSSSMRGASAPAVELNAASLQHVRRLLRQMLQDAKIPEIKRWEKALMPILLQCTDDVNPDIQRNDDIDIRHYIKLKKIPGSKPGDTSYVSGVVFTKNLALKSMSRSIPTPRIAVVTFPIEYARHHQHFMSLDPVISQEREYLRNLVKRIAALNPQVLLVEKNVAGLALEFLDEAGIAVVSNVKASVLNAVSRCTQTRLITSPDKLAIDPSQLGRCASFDVKTYVHGSMKKTFVYLSGCQKDLGCTIVLRGAEMGQLRKLKRITEFMCYVVYNLKLETCVMRDEYVLIPATLSGGTLATSKRKTAREVMDSSDSSPPRIDNPGNGTNNQDDNAAPNGGGIDTSAEDSPHEVQQTSIIPSFYNDVVEKHKTKIISASPFVKFMQPYLLTQARELEAKLSELKRLRDQYVSTTIEEQDEKSSTRFELVQPEMVHRLVEKPSKQVRDFLFAVHNAQYEKALHNYQTQKRQWEAYLSGNSGLFDPFNHQRIVVLYSMVNSKTSSPCVGPDVIALSFYNEHDLEEDFLPDITIGQYVEDLCHGATTTCTANGCEEQLLNHHRQYVHGEGQMSVIVQKYPSRMRGMHNTILMWSCCRICGQETQVIPMSENTWKYSFGKYLELTFWSTDLHPRAHACPHDIHKNHVRYFGFNNFAVRVQWDPVGLHEIIVPRATITWQVDSDLQLKNDQYLRFKSRLDRFIASVRARIDSIRLDSVALDKIEECKAEVERLKKKVNDDHDSFTRSLQEKYMTSRYYEIIPLNRAAKALHENSIEWDDVFAEFEKNYFPSEKDIRRLAQIQINKFLDRDSSTTTIGSIEEGNEETATETKDLATTPALPEITRLPTTLSPEDTQNVLVSIVKEQQINEKQSSDGLGPPPPASEIPNLPNPIQIETPIEALDREDVKHLDLAVSSDFPTGRSSGTDSDTTEKSRNSRDSSGRGTPTLSESQRLELSPQVSQTVEQMRNDSALQESALETISPESIPPETRIPRPVDPSRFSVRPVSPPLLRTRSQPSTALLLKRERPVNESSASSSNSTLTLGTEKLRNFITDPARALERRMGAGTFRSSRSTSKSLIPRSVPAQRNDSRVLTLRHHFEELSKEFEKQRMRERQQRDARSRQTRAYPFASSQPIVEVYRDAQEAVQERESTDEEETPRVSTDTSHLEESSVTDTTAPSADNQGSPTTEVADDQPTKDADHNTEEGTEAPRTSDAEGGEASDAEEGVSEDIEIPEPGTESQSLSPSDSQLDLVELKHEKTSLLKMLTSFWSERSASGWTPLEYPFLANEHVWGDSDIIVREDEPSSLIALALSSADYEAKVRSFRGLPEQNPTEAEIDESIEKNLMHERNTNIRYAFQNRGVRAQCKIFYAESFDALRRKCGVADRFVESLSRCLKWDSKGGKTKSLFLKTLDDRFILKSLSKVEVDAFFKFAPNYFSFMHQNLFHGMPSVIAKMMGLFQVTIRSPGSGLEFNWFMLVMENLFYEQSPNRRFDLKGSMRNRKIQSTGERDEVLLDENLVDIIFEKPIFVREHTMKLLKASVWNDTLFLSKQNVMDYSLMAGFDDEAKEIIVGIIDCIRTYTWDKKLETWIKDRGKNKPTVTSPKDYRNRFRVAMSKYILQAPTCWHQFQHQQIQGRSIRLHRREEEYHGGEGGFGRDEEY